MIKKFFKIWVIGLVFLIISNVIFGKGYDSVLEMLTTIGVQVIFMSIVAFIIVKFSNKKSKL